MSNDEIIRLAALAGWRITPVPLYDEEGVDGWQWDGPNGEEYHSLEGHMPDELKPKRPEANPKKDFAAFLDSLLNPETEK